MLIKYLGCINGITLSGCAALPRMVGIIYLSLKQLSQRMRYKSRPTKRGFKLLFLTNSSFRSAKNWFTECRISGTLHSAHCVTVLARMRQRMFFRFPFYKVNGLV